MALLVYWYMLSKQMQFAALYKRKKILIYNKMFYYTISLVDGNTILVNSYMLSQQIQFPALYDRKNILIYNLIYRMYTISLVDGTASKFALAF